ncbi:TetR/AcrR family transcriptional regulator [Acidimangrovimonas pyrenivorans]|uniref:TetR/AcrR family transcriptional regulator n=1 Tax=Acidimangrovimonas pyrenivorans TaxID=2030798 RepID=A0ABV7AMC1_9RHOB
MSRPRFDKLDPARQQRLFDNAAEEFGDKGYDGASLNRILERSGMSKSSLYYYFDDKADLFTTLVERSVGFMLREIGGFDPADLTAETYWSEMEALYRRSVGMMNKSTWYVKMGRMFYRLRGDPKKSAPTGRLFQAARHWVGVIVARGQELGVVRRDLPDSLLIDSAMGLGEALDRWIVAHWDDYSPDERLQMAEQHIGLFRALLAPPVAPAAD